MEIQAIEKDAPHGNYEVRIEEIREANEKDRLQIAAVQAHSEASKLEGQNESESKTKAIVKYEEALKLYREAGDHRGEGAALHRIGRVYWDQNEFQKALDYFNQALPLYHETGDRQSEASILSDIGGTYGDIYSNIFDRQKALSYCDLALPIAQAIGDKELESRVLYSKALLYDRIGEWQTAIEFYQKSLPPRRAAGDRIFESAIFNNIGMAYFDSGEPYKALDYFNQALSVDQTNSPDNVSGRLHNIGMTYESIGNHQKALDILNQALELAQNARDDFMVTVISHTLSQVWKSLGEYERALTLLNQALPIAHASGVKDFERVLLINTGLTHKYAGNYQKAIEFFNKAALIKQPGDGREADPVIISSLSEVYFALGDKQKAQELLHQALPLYRSNEKRGKMDALRNLGKLYVGLKNPEKALVFLNQALELEQAISGAQAGTDTLLAMARAERERGNLDVARRKCEAALANIESSRSNLVSPDVRASYFTTVQELYDFYITLLMQSRKQQSSAALDAMALQANESQRARSLLDLMAEAQTDIQQGADPKLLDEEKTLRQRLNAKGQFRIRLLGANRPAEQVKIVEKEIDDLHLAHQRVQDQIRKTSPRYAALTQPHPLSLKEIQLLLDQDTLLLEYFLGTDSSYLWAITPNSITSYELPSRKEIEAAATQLYTLMTARQPGRGETQQQYATRIAEADAKYEQQVAKLSQLLLAPVAAQLGTKQLLIVTDGALQYVPFAALPAPPTDKQNGASLKTPLIATHEVINLPSASVLAVMRQETARRSPAAKQVAVLADPVFDKDDRVQKNAPPVNVVPQNDSAIGKRALRDAGLFGDGTSVPRLPFTRQEAEAITAMVPATTTLKALGFKANLATVKSPELSHYRIVHFATHALINTDHPFLSGLLLSLVDEQGKPQDGFLSLNDVYNLNLPADLVLLSACQTAKGKESAAKDSSA